VGRKIKKANNETETTIRAKRINLPGQSVLTENKGDAVTGRGLSMPELLNQTQHYSGRVRKVGRCRLTVSKPVLKAPMLSALETIIS